MIAINFITLLHMNYSYSFFLQSLTYFTYLNTLAPACMLNVNMKLQKHYYCGQILKSNSKV